MPMSIELFVSDCDLCVKTEEMIKKVKGPKCSLKIYNLNKREGTKKVKKYKITAVPTIVGNGKKCLKACQNMRNCYNAV